MALKTATTLPEAVDAKKVNQAAFSYGRGRAVNHQVGYMLFRVGVQTGQSVGTNTTLDILQGLISGYVATKGKLCQDYTLRW